MDPVTLVYYAVICGLLSAFGPRLARRIVRLSIGAVIGLIAAAALPYLKTALPYY